MSKLSCYFIFFICASLGTALKFSHHHERIPLGCDEFGYLNLTKAFDENHEFKLPPQKAYLSGLIDTLRKCSIPDLDFAWMIGPHAYHLIPGTKKLINQYAPGTSMLMLVSGIAWRQITFPAIMMGLFIFLIVLINREQIKNRVTLFDFYLPALCLGMILMHPMQGVFQGINSLAPTFGFLFAAGMLLHSKPLLATFLIAITVNFRIVNGLMLLPVLLYLPFQWPIRKNNLYTNAALLTKYTLLITLAALPLFWYNYNLSGKLFFITHSIKDQENASWNGVIDNIKFYLSPIQRWLIVNIATFLATICLQRISKIDRRNLFLVSFLIINYAFFIIHRVKIGYYPYAPAIIFLGVIGGLLMVIEYNEKKVAHLFILMTSIIFLLKGSLDYIHHRPHKSFTEYKSKYLDLCTYDIVWCDEYSGTAEYTCTNSGFRYAWGPTTARKIAFEYFKNHRLKQAILLFDIPINRSEIIDEIESFGLSYHITKESLLGEIIEID
ncbi:MAG: hypothetical protein ABIR66_04025 [Saprospiraceae bacterium]